MKRNLIKIATILSAGMLMSIGLFAQNNGQRSGDEYQTLLNRDRIKSHGAYCGLEFGYTEVASRSSLLTGFTAAWVVDHTLELGFVAKGFVTNPLPDIILQNQNYLYTGGYGGLHIAANVLGYKPINVSFPVTIGAGGVSYIRSQYNGYFDDFYPETYYAYFVVEPGVEVQLNMTRFFRISAGVSYRYTSDIYLLYSNTNADPVASPSLLRGLNGSVKFKFGKF